MKHLIQYSSKVSNLFYSYIHGDTEQEDLIKELGNIEAFHRGAIADIDQSYSLWFRFSESDNLVTTINDLAKDLNSSKNREFTIERMEEAISLDGEILIYYS